jgi:hypothetical protein
MNYVNRIKHLLGKPIMEAKSKGPFSDREALDLLMSYRSNPAMVPCPLCGPNCMEVLAFIKPRIDPSGRASVTEPEGEYAAALYCHKCQRAIGIIGTADKYQH